MTSSIGNTVFCLLRKSSVRKEKEVLVISADLAISRILFRMIEQQVRFKELVGKGAQGKK